MISQGSNGVRVHRESGSERLETTTRPAYLPPTTRHITLLVLGCTNTFVGNQVFIFQRFSRSTK